MIVRSIIEILFSLGLFINAALFVPQVIKLFHKKDSSEISLMTFGGFNFLQLLMVLHGYLHSDYLLMLGGVLSLATCGSVTCLTIFYRLK